MNGALFYILLAACSHDGEQCHEVRMTTARLNSRHECLAVLEREMASWRVDAPVILGDCTLFLASAPDWWRQADVATN